MSQPGHGSRILMLSTHGYVAAEPELGKPDTGGQVVFVLELARQFADLGHTVDIVTRRIDEHNGLSGNGAKYTSARRPVELVYEDSFSSRSEALKEELRVKQLTRSQKQELISERRAVGHDCGFETV